MSRIRANKITNQAANGAPIVEHGLVVSGILSATSVAIAGTITYEDVTSIDSVGIITARSTFDAQGDVLISDKIVHKSDTNTAIRFPTNDNITFETGGTERLRIDSSGRVAIGLSAYVNTTPSEYDAAANTLIVGTGSGDEGITILSGQNVGNYGSIFFADGSGATNSKRGQLRYEQNNEVMSFYTAGTEKVRILSGGNLLIGGTTSRSLGWEHLLQVEHTNSTPHGISIVGNRANQYGPNLSFAKSRSSSLGGNTIVQDNDTLAQLVFRGADGVDLNNVSAMIRVVVDGTPAENNVPGAFEIYTGGQNQRLTIDSSGRVMIGTTTEGHENADDLTVAGSTNSGITIRSGTSNSGAIYFSDATSGTAEYAGFVGYSHANNSMTFGTNTAIKLRIMSNGYFGFGIDSPSRRIHVHTAGSGSDYMQFTNDTTGTTSGDGYVFGISADEDVIHNNLEATNMRFYTSGAERLRIDSSGHIGMGGNTNPTNVLHIKTAVTNTAVATIESTATNSYPFLRLKNDAREYQLTCHGGLSDAFTIYDGTSSTHRFTISADGKVGINETNPSAQLHVENDNANASTYWLNTDATVLIQNKNSNASAKTVLKLEGPVGGGDCALVYGDSSANLIFSDRENERMRITSTGYVSGNINVPCWYGSQDTEHNVANATFVRLMNLGNDVTNPSMNNGGWNESTGTFTAQAGQAGTYYVFGGGGIDDIQANDYIHLRFFKNGSAVGPYARHTNGGGANQISDARHMMIVTLAEGDTIDLRIYHNEGSTEPTEPNRCFFGGYRLSV